MRGIDRTVKVQQPCCVPSTSSPRQPRPLSIQSTPSTLSTQSKTRPHRRQAAVISGWPAAGRRWVIATPPDGGGFLDSVDWIDSVDWVDWVDWIDGVDGGQY